MLTVKPLKHPVLLQWLQAAMLENVHIKMKPYIVRIKPQIQMTLSTVKLNNIKIIIVCMMMVYGRLVSGSVGMCGPIMECPETADNLCFQTLNVQRKQEPLLRTFF